MPNRPSHLSRRRVHLPLWRVILSDIITAALILGVRYPHIGTANQNVNDVFVLENITFRRCRGLVPLLKVL
jgi:hypothetical protein